MKTFADEDYVIGGKAFYKQQSLKRWHDQDTNNGFDSKVLVQHGSTFYKCHPCYAMKVKAYFEA